MGLNVLINVGLLEAKAAADSVDGDLPAIDQAIDAGHRNFHVFGEFPRGQELVWICVFHRSVGVYELLFTRRAERPPQRAGTGDSLHSSS